MMDDDKMTDETLSTLKLLRTSAPSAEAKKLALNAAMLAFDAAQPRKAAAKTGWLNRWKLGAGFGVPLGTAVAALVLLPLGTQLYTASSRHTDRLPPETIVSDDGQQKQVAIAAADQPARQDAVDGKVKTTTTTTLSLQQQPVAEKPALKDTEIAQSPVADGRVTTEEAMPQMDQLATMTPSPSQGYARDAAKLAAAPPVAEPEGEADLMPPSTNTGLMGGMAQPTTAVPLEPSGDTFQKFDENRVKITRDEPVSTFSIDVDTASYSYVRGLLKDGYLPDPEAVRLEEMINYFPYDYPAPASLDTPFKATMAVIPTPWNPRTELLEIGIKGYVPPATGRAPENLTFLIDTSGSMDEPNKLPLLKRSFGLLVDTLQPNDTVSIVTYAGSAGVALQPTKASARSAILSALDQMVADGSTDGVDGIALAYKVNAEAKGEGTINRVILATDGDFNVGISEPDELKTYIKTQRGNGIFLSVLGFGRGNLDDELMQSLAQNGNGNASYIDNFQEAQKVLVEEGGANMVTIAKDVKIQVEFNPAQVSEYRLIGYETRALNREDFNNDAVDAGEIGAGHTVTAIYEITPVGAGADLSDPLRYGASTAPAPTSHELGFLKMRYKTPEGEVSKLIQTPIGKDLVVDNVQRASPDQRFAASVAAFGQKLKGSNYGEAMTWQQISDLANGAKGADTYGYRAEFVQMVRLAALLNPDHVSGRTESAPN